MLVHSSVSAVSILVADHRHHSVAVLVVVLLAHREWNITVLDHVLDLFAHGQEEEDDPVEEQNGPENGHIEDLEPAAQERNNNSPRSPVPELELRKAADERLELLVGLGGEGAHGPILHLIIKFIARGVELGLEESEEEVQEVDAERVRNDVPSLCEEDAKEEEEEADTGANPTIGDKGGRLIEECLVPLRKPRGRRADGRERGLLRLLRIHREQICRRL
jgi:hypothetical protein